MVPPGRECTSPAVRSTTQNRGRWPPVDGSASRRMGRSLLDGAIFAERDAVAARIVADRSHVGTHQEEAAAARPVQILRQGGIGHLRWVKAWLLVLDFGQHKAGGDQVA